MSENAPKCTSCGSETELKGVYDFRIGGTSGGWKLLFGEWAELGESMIPLRVYICPRCGKLEFYEKKK